jgi:hypothetical protein
MIGPAADGFLLRGPMKTLCVDRFATQETGPEEAGNSGKQRG